jgi:hypothetical protein
VKYGKMADQENPGKEGHGLGGEELIHIQRAFGNLTIS